MFSSEAWLAKSGGFYNGVATTSYRNEPAVVLTKEQDAPTSSKIMSMGGWIKRNKVGHYSNVFSGSLGGAGVPQAFLYIDNTNNRLEVLCYNGSAYVFRYMVSRKFRDVSAWYHLWLQIDSTEGNNATADRVKIYVNGVRETTYDDTPTHIADGTPDIRGFNEDGIKQYFGHTNASYGGHLYYSDWYFIDGLAVSPVDTVGEFKNGVFIPKAYTPTEFGNNGFHLKFDQTGVGTPSATTIGADSSIKANHFTSTEGTNVEAHDCAMPDSPENNFCTLNPLIRPYEVTPAETVSDGNLNAFFNSNAVSGSYWSTFFLTSGKWYFEVYVQAIGGNADVGINNKPSDAGRGTYTNDARGNGYFYQKDGQKGINNSFSTYGATYTTGDLIGCAFDLDNNTITFFKDNASQGQISSVATPEDGFLPAIEGFNGTRLIANFGQDPSFSGEITAGTATGTGAGVFKYAPPSSFLAICTANLPETTISPNSDTQADDYFNTVLYSGVTGDQSITGVGFQPDLTWIKSRSGAYNHNLLDSARGGRRWLGSNSEAGQDYQTSSYISSFDSDGFTLDGDGGSTNVNGTTYVAWNWKAGGATPTKTYKVKVVSDSTDFGHGTGSNKYQFFKSDGSTGFGTNGVDLDLQEGGTYTFDWSDSSAQSHPLRFSLTNDGTHSSGTSAGSEYTTGVVKDDSAYLTTITLPTTASGGVANLYYYCQNHSGMGAEVRTNTLFGQTNFDAGSGSNISNGTANIATVQANQDAGFSIVTTTLTVRSTAVATIPHGLGSTPHFILAKQYDTANIWSIYHQDIPSNSLMLGGSYGDDAMNSSSNFSSVGNTTFGHQTNSISNNANENHIFYCFKEIAGYSRFGSYVGNGDPNGTFVFLGFRPAFVLIKRTSGTPYDWMLVDSTRDTINPVDNTLFPSANTQELDGDDKDFVSNGFKHRSNGASENATGVLYVYMAFAEVPFKYANAR